MRFFLFVALGAAIALLCLNGLLPSSAKAQVASQVTSPSCKNCPHPDFPSKAKSPSAVVQLDTVISAEGKVISVQIVSDPGEGFGAKAAEAVKKWKFKPAVGPSGKPVMVRVRIEVKFERH